ncbi:MAG: TRAP transporter large permease subunit [Deltaproteobacteria bacterium]|nr:TRAP transporter large permease subunit [Deltaproteobacteria bacterium]
MIGKIFGLTDQNVLLAILFVVAGSLMTAGGIARRIVDFADALIGWLAPWGHGRGGGAVVHVSSPPSPAARRSTVIAIGSIMMPALVAKGRRRESSRWAWSPPRAPSASSSRSSIPPIIYAIMGERVMSVNVADFFMAGIGP